MTALCVQYTIIGKWTELCNIFFHTKADNCENVMIYMCWQHAFPGRFQRVLCSVYTETQQLKKKRLNLIFVIQFANNREMIHLSHLGLI